jgi:glycosyltransferase involved in cell wall biosynthesis
VFVGTDDPDAIARAVEGVLADPAAAVHRATLARQRAERYAAPLIAQQYLAVYDDVLSRHTRGSHQMAS